MLFPFLVNTASIPCVCWPCSAQRKFCSAQRKLRPLNYGPTNAWRRPRVSQIYRTVFFSLFFSLCPLCAINLFPPLCEGWPIGMNLTGWKSSACCVVVRALIGWWHLSLKSSATRHYSSIAFLLVRCCFSQKHYPWLRLFAWFFAKINIPR